MYKISSFYFSTLFLLIILILNHFLVIMSTLKLRISKLPTTETSLTNKVYLNQSDLDAALTRFLKIGIFLPSLY